MTKAIALATFLLLFSCANQSDTAYQTFISKIGLLQDSVDVAQYANVRYCDKVVSVTANHVAKYIDKIKPDARLLAASREYDIAIYEILGNATASTLAQELPDSLTVIYIPTYIWMNNSLVVLQTHVIGYERKEILIQGVLFFGISGSGVYNKDGEYLGPVLSMLEAPGMEKGTIQQAGIGGIGRTDKLIELFKAKICSK